VETAATPALERASEDVPSRVQRLAALAPGVSAAVLVAAIGFSHGGYFATAWGPLTLVFLAVAALALIVRPTPSLGLRELAVPALLGAFAAWALASAIWGSPSEAVPEAQRALTYASGALAFALVLRPQRVGGFLTGVWAGICIVCLDALSGRLFPERFGEYDPIGGYRLSEPVGYWNALGLLTAFGFLLALALVARVENLVVRLTAAASTVPLGLTLYFTFSRGAWLALAAGLVVALVLDPRRLQVAAAALVVAPWAALAVWLASSSGPLTEKGHTLVSASQDGHALAAAAAGLALGAAASAAFLAGVGGYVRISRSVSRAASLGLAAGLVAALVLGLVALGGPSRIARSFAAAPKASGDKLHERLFDLSGSGRVDGWRVALDDARQHRLVGSGGGSYKRYWVAHRPYSGAIRDAHSLYLETLAEYGPLGLTLLVAVFGVPLGLAVRFRRQPLVPAAAGVLATYVVHASIDWDWEFPALTLVALASAAAIVGSGEHRPAARFERRRAVLLVVVLVLVPAAALGALGARAEASSVSAAGRRDYDRAAEDARRAERLAPWSVQPLLLLGRAQVAAGDRRAARATFERALRREPGFWRLWYELAAVTSGAERRAALREARALNPLEPRLHELADASP
jgi:hypothetical protein